MNKLFTKIATFAIGAFMAVGVGVAATLSGSEPIEARAETGTATLSIAGKTGVVSGESISWTVDNVTFTNNKSKSTTAIRTSDSDHYRIYAKSSATITAPDNITKIVATCTSNDYATVFGTSAGQEATASGPTVTIVPQVSSSAYSIASFTAQTRITTIIVTYGDSSGEDVGGGSTTAVEDKLTRATTGNTSTGYSSWTGKRANSSAVYAGNSAGEYESIQLRSTNSNSGIVTTTSGGKITKIVVEWNTTNTSDGRTLNVYGKNTAYSEATDLYDSNNQGTKLGSIVCGTSTELIVNGSYEYVGVRSSSGAMYLTSITFTWESTTTIPVTEMSLTSANYTPVDGIITLNQGSGDLEDTLSASITPENASDKTVSWASSDENIAVVESGEVLIDTSNVGEATITATANGGTNVSASITYQIINASAQEFDIVTNVSNGSSVGDTTIIEGLTATITISANDGYKLPENVSVTNATLESYDSTTGVVIINNPTGDVTISAVCVELATFTISVVATNCTYTGSEDIKEKGSAEITFAAEDGYALPENLEVINANHEWNSTTGVLRLSNPTGNVTITVTASTYTNEVGLDLTKDFLIMGTDVDSSTNYYLKENGGSLPSAVASEDDATRFVLTLIGNDTFKLTVKNTDAHLYSINDNKGIRVGTDANDAWKITAGSDKEGGEYDVMHVATERYLSLYLTQDFRGYSAGTNRRAVTLVPVDRVEFGTLTSIEVSEESGHKTSFYVGEEFNYDNLTISLIDEKGYSMTVETGFTLDLEEGYVFTSSDIGTKSITVSYEEISTTYDIIINDKLSGITKEYVFSDYEPGTQYAVNEKHDLKENVLTMTTTHCHFTDELRMYNSKSGETTYDSAVTINSTRQIISITLNAGYKADTVILNGTHQFQTTTSYNDYTVVFDSPVNEITIDVEGTQQVRIKDIQIEYVAISSDEFSTLFLEKTATVCADNGLDDNGSELANIWAEIEDLMYFVTETTKEELKTYSHEGMERYTHIVNRYVGLNDFLGRRSQTSGLNSYLFATGNLESHETILIIVSALFVLTVGGYYFIKKRKEQ